MPFGTWGMRIDLPDPSCTTKTRPGGAVRLPSDRSGDIPRHSVSHGRLGSKDTERILFTDK